MNDRYLFRGKRTDNGEWVIGCYFEHLPPLVAIVSKNYVPKPSTHWIITNGDADWGLPRPRIGYEVDPDTIGQCTGLKDKNGEYIFEGDIIKTDKSDCAWFDNDLLGVVEYCALEGLYCVGTTPLQHLVAHTNSEKPVAYSKKIGNVHDNLDLLETPPQQPPEAQ